MARYSALNDRRSSLKTVFVFLYHVFARAEWRQMLALSFTPTTRSRGSHDYNSITFLKYMYVQQNRTVSVLRIHIDSLPEHQAGTFCAPRTGQVAFGSDLGGQSELANAFGASDQPESRNQALPNYFGMPRSRRQPANRAFRDDSTCNIYRYPNFRGNPKPRCNNLPNVGIDPTLQHPDNTRTFRYKTRYHSSLTTLNPG